MPQQLPQMIEWIAPAGVIGAVIFFQLRLRRPKTPVEEIRRLIEKEGAAFIDVRSASEFARGSLPGARNVPVDRLASNMRQLNREKAVVVYCQSGARSAYAAKILREAGFGHVHDLGSISNWH